jgi:hypothetical protein
MMSTPTPQVRSIPTELGRQKAAGPVVSAAPNRFRESAPVKSGLIAEAHAHSDSTPAGV